MKKIFREPDFGCDQWGNPCWHHRYTASAIVGVVIGLVFGVIVLVVEL